MGEKNEQVIPNTENIHVAKLACALEITKLVSHQVGGNAKNPQSAEDCAERLTEIFKKAYKSISEII